MRKLTLQEMKQASGGEFVHGTPTPEMMCINVKLMLWGRGEPGFDISAAVHSLMKYCHDDFWDLNQAHEYVMSGAYP
ncbi:MAG: hypothetical protein AB7V32_11370 [Candidatus Berkiella sp.]